MDQAPGAEYLQTWHGTPLKHIHFDVFQAPPGRLDYLTRDVRRWDHLISPNQASTGPLRQAFGFTGEVAETGYPRNDVLVSPHAGEVRANVRAQFGIPDDKKIVLYTPTWRDDLLDEDGKQDFRLHLDLDQFSEQLGDDHVLLMRLHYMVSGRLGDIDHPGVFDVSFHPNVSDLYLAADVMITDYSSTMFDFAVTGKPLLFFTYDLAHYRDTLRGFYFDFHLSAPGPLLHTNAEVFRRTEEPGPGPGGAPRGLRPVPADIRAPGGRRGRRSGGRPVLLRRPVVVKHRSVRAHRRSGRSHRKFGIGQVTLQGRADDPGQFLDLGPSQRLDLHHQPDHGQSDQLGRRQRGA